MDVESLVDSSGGSSGYVSRLTSSVRWKCILVAVIALLMAQGIVDLDLVSLWGDAVAIKESHLIKLIFGALLYYVTGFSASFYFDRQRDRRATSKQELNQTKSLRMALFAWTFCVPIALAAYSGSLLFPLPQYGNYGGMVIENKSLALQEERAVMVDGDSDSWASLAYAVKDVKARLALLPGRPLRDLKQRKAVEDWRDAAGYVHGVALSIESSLRAGEDAATDVDLDHLKAAAAESAIRAVAIVEACETFLAKSEPWIEDEYAEFEVAMREKAAALRLSLSSVLQPVGGHDASKNDV